MGVTEDLRAMSEEARLMHVINVKAAEVDELKTALAKKADECYGLVNKNSELEHAVRELRHNWDNRDSEVKRLNGLLAVKSEQINRLMVAAEAHRRESQERDERDWIEYGPPGLPGVHTDKLFDIIQMLVKANLQLALRSEPCHSAIPSTPGQGR